MMPPTPEALAQSRAAHAGIVRLLRERGGRGLELPVLLELRHLSRVCSTRCPGVVPEPQAVLLETLLGELHAESRAACGAAAFLERCIGKLLGEIETALSRAQTRELQPKGRALCSSTS
jgi:hypothetical protein